MKKLFFFLFFAAAMTACNNGETTKTTETPAATAPDNVDGNLPDSTNSINLNKPLPVDSSALKDSTPR